MHAQICAFACDVTMHCVCIVTAFVLVSASFMHTLITTDACRDGCQARGYGNVRVDK